jgi:hypothetical protein
MTSKISLASITLAPWAVQATVAVLALVTWAKQQPLMIPWSVQKQIGL